MLKAQKPKKTKKKSECTVYSYLLSSADIENDTEKIIKVDTPVFRLNNGSIVKTDS